MKLRYPEDGYTRPAIIFFRAIGRLALRPRSQPAIPSSPRPTPPASILPPSSLPPIFLPSPKGKSMSMLCSLSTPSFLSLSLADRRHFFQLIFFLPLLVPSFGRIMTENRRKMRRRESWRRERVFPTRGAESLESRAHGCPRKSLFFSSRRREMRARARGIRKGSIGSFFFFFFLIVSASEPERSTLLLGNSSSSVAEISINHYVIHPELILDEEEL